LLFFFFEICLQLDLQAGRTVCSLALTASAHICSLLFFQNMLAAGLASWPHGADWQAGRTVLRCNTLLNFCTDNICNTCLHLFIVGVQLDWQAGRTVLTADGRFALRPAGSKSTETRPFATSVGYLFVCS
jgi:hypothetical protein